MSSEFPNAAWAHKLGSENSLPSASRTSISEETSSNRWSSDSLSRCHTRQGKEISIINSDKFVKNCIKPLFPFPNFQNFITCVCNMSINPQESLLGEGLYIWSLWGKNELHFEKTNIRYSFLQVFLFFPSVNWFKALQENHEAPTDKLVASLKDRQIILFQHTWMNFIHFSSFT